MKRALIVGLVVAGTAAVGFFVGAIIFINLLEDEAEWLDDES